MLVNTLDIVLNSFLQFLRDYYNQILILNQPNQLVNRQLPIAQSPSIVITNTKEMRAAIDMAITTVTKTVTSTNLKMATKTVENILTVTETQSSILSVDTTSEQLFIGNLTAYWKTLIKEPTHFYSFLFLFIVFCVAYMIEITRRTYSKFEQLYDETRLDITSFEAGSLQNLSYLENLSKQQLLGMKSEFLTIEEQLIDNNLEVAKQIAYLQNEFKEFKDMYLSHMSINDNNDNRSKEVITGKNLLEDLLSVSSSQEDEDNHQIMKNGNKNNNVDILEFLDKPFQVPETNNIIIEDSNIDNKLANVEYRNESVILNEQIQTKMFSDRKTKLKNKMSEMCKKHNYSFEPDLNILNFLKDCLSVPEFFTNMYGINYDTELASSLQETNPTEEIEENFDILKGKEDNNNFKKRFFLLKSFHDNYLVDSVDLDRLEILSEEKNIKNIITISNSERTILFQVTILALRDLAIFNIDNEDKFELIINGLLDLLKSGKLNDNKFLKKIYFLNFFKLIHKLNYSTKLTEVVINFRPAKNKLKYYINVLNVIIFIVFKLNKLDDQKKDRSLLIEFFRNKEFIESYNKSTEIKTMTSNIYVALKFIHWNDECCNVMFNELFDSKTKTKLDNYYQTTSPH